MNRVQPTLRLVDPRQRVDRVSFHPKVETTDHLIHVGAYRCPHCGTETEIHTGTLRQSAERPATPFGRAWEEACTKARPVGDREWFVDFACAGCGGRVRLVCGLGEEFAMGAYVYDLRGVIETRQPPGTARTSRDRATDPARSLLRLLGVAHVLVAVALLPVALAFGPFALPVLAPGLIWLAVLGVRLWRPDRSLQRAMRVTHTVLAAVAALLVAYGGFGLEAARRSAEAGGGLLGAVGLIPIALGVLAASLAVASLFVARSSALTSGLTFAMGGVGGPGVAAADRSASGDDTETPRS